MNFIFKDFYKSLFGKHSPQANPGKFFMSNVASGAAAGATGMLVVYPLDYLRTRVGVDVGVCKNTREFTGHVDCFKKTLESDGIRGFYRGMGISISGVILYRAAYFGCFDTGKSMLFSDPREANVLSMWMFA
mmetsp:Transcript_6208/g.7949  ORF Transcript_6208/g.7949 Transcript_6208/m.7949 type:complete len:132 (-) Transcript_6208:147-542(-)